MTIAGVATRNGRTDAIRPIEASTDAISYGSNTSSPAVRSAQEAVIPDRVANGPNQPGAPRRAGSIEMREWRPALGLAYGVIGATIDNAKAAARRAAPSGLVRRRPHA